MFSKGTWKAAGEFWHDGLATLNSARRGELFQLPRRKKRNGDDAESLDDEPLEDDDAVEMEDLAYTSGRADSVGRQVTGSEARG